jgi:hypothetical protein
VHIADDFDAAGQLPLCIYSFTADVIKFFLFLHSDAMLVLELLLELGVIS